MSEVNSPLPKGWLELPIVEVADVSLGKTPKKSHYANEGKIRLIKFRDVTEDGLNLSETKDAFVKDGPDAIKGLQPVQKGDILLTASAHSPQYIGRKVAIVDKLPEGFDYFYVGELLNIRPHDGIDPRWIAAYLRSEQGYKNIQAHVHGMHLTTGRAHNILIRIAPPNYMQMAIKAIDTLQERSQRVRKALAEAGSLLEQFRQSVLAAAFRGDLTADWRTAHPSVEPASELLHRIRVERRRLWEQAELAKYEAKSQKPPKNWKDKYEAPDPVDDSDLPELPDGWCWASIEEISLFVTDGDHNPPKRVGSGIPHLTAKNIKNWSVNFDGCSYLTPEGFEQTRRRYEPHPGDLIVTCVGTLGQTAIVPKNCIFSADRNLAAIRVVPSGVNVETLMYALNTRRAQLHMGAISGSTAQPHVYLADLRALRLQVPPLAEQCEINRRIQRAVALMDEIQLLIRESLSRNEELDQSILVKTFRGELVPQEPNDEPASVLLARIREQRAQQTEAAKGTRKTINAQRRDKMGKQSSEVASQHRPLVEVLTTKGKPISPEQLLTEAGYDDDTIEDFYLVLREEIAQGRILENRLTESDVMLEAVKQ
jgi:type I restriction enzyme S subunit